MKTYLSGILAAALLLPVAARADRAERMEKRGERMEKQGERREKRAAALRNRKPNAHRATPATPANPGVSPATPATPAGDGK